MEHYTLTYRLENKKLTGIAGIAFDGRTCLRAAEIAFQKEGFSTNGNYSVYYSNQLMKQKNYTGKAPVYQEI
jgi:hypothetical protein